MIFDTHAHYDDIRFDETRDEVILNLPSGGVCGVINCGSDILSSEKSVELANKYDFFYAAVGIHPESVTTDSVFESSLFEKLIKNKNVVAIGEIGLDYHWDASLKDKQINLFEQQVVFANNHLLPVIVHDREAHFDTLEILKKHRPTGVVHCFSGSVEMAKEIIGLGMYVGIGGVLTFKNAKKLCEVAKEISLERILLETDAPYMAPEPFRGKTNNSTFIDFVAQKLAEIKNISKEEILKITRSNAEKLFGI